MIKRVMKRSLSIFLTLLLIATTFFIFDPSVLKMDASAYVEVDTNQLETSMPIQTANAPETIYLKPGEKTFQYFSLINSETGAAGNSKATSGAVTFTNTKATHVALFINNFWKRDSKSSTTYSDASANISKFKPNDANIAGVAKLDGTKGGGNTSVIPSGTTKLVDGGGGVINYAIGPNSKLECDEGDVYIVEWGIEYVVDGLYHYTFLYTGFYKPILTITGATARGKHSNTFNVPKAAGFGFITGAMNYAEVGNRSFVYKNTTFGVNSAPLVGFVGQQNNGTAGQYTVPNVDTGFSSETNFPSSGSPKTILVTTGTHDAKDDGENYDVWTTYSSWGSYASPTGISGTNHADAIRQGAPADKYTGIAYEIVDTSRFTDYSQIPNLSAGFIRYYHDRGDDVSKLRYIRCENSPTSDASGSAGVVAAGVDTENHSSNPDEWQSRTYGLYSFSGATTNGQKNMYVMFKYSQDRTGGDVPVHLHIGVGLSVYGVNKDGIRKAYASSMTSNIDKATYDTVSSGAYANYYTNMMTQARYLCDPTATTATVSVSKDTVDSVQESIAAANAEDLCTFYVPETIYLTPVNGNMSTFQYYVDRANAVNGGLRTGEQTSGNVYFNSPRATNVSITCTGATVNGKSAGSAIFTGTTSVASTITSGTLGTAIAANASTLLEWTATFVIDGATCTAKAYSVAYAPMITVASGSADGRYDSSYSDRVVKHCITTWVAGLHTLDTSRAFSKDSDGTGVYKHYPLVAGNAIPSGGSSGDILNSGTGGNYFYKSDDDATNVDGGGGTINIDVSRYSNLNEIPNLKIGLDMNGLTGNGTSGKYSRLGYWRDGAASNTTNAGNKDTGSQGSSIQGTNIFTSKVSDTIVTTANQKYDIYGYNEMKGSGNGSTRASGSYASFTTHPVNKGAIRTAINDAIATGRQKDWYTSATWTTYENALKAAVTALGKPNDTSDLTTLNTSLTNAIAGLKKVAGTLTANHVGTDGKVLANPAETESYEAGDTTYAASNQYDGYTLTSASVSTPSGNRTLTVKDGAASEKIVNNVNASTTYTFTYTPNKYDVTYDTDGGTYNNYNDSQLYTDIAQYNAAFKVGAVALGGSAVTAPTRDGYIFNNWLCSQNQVVYTPDTQINPWVWGTDSVVFKAQWIPIEYTIAFDKNADDATGTMGTISGVKYGETVKLLSNGFTRANYTFLGWNTKADGTGEQTFEDGDNASNLTTTNGATVTLYAQWQVDAHTAKAYAYSNTAMAGYTNNTTGGTVQVNNAAAGASSEAEINYNASYTLKATPNTTGYYFDGWFDNSELSGNPLSTSASYSQTMGAGDKNWYAKFSVEQYNITMYRNYDNSDSNVINNLTGVKYGSSWSVTIPTRTGYVFNGWYSARSGGSKVYGTSSPITIIDHGSNNANISLYAQWTANTITVAYAPGSGSGSMSNGSFSYGSNFTPANCTFTAPASKIVTFNANGGSCGTASLPSAYTFNKWKSSANDALYAAGTAVNDNLGASSGTVTLTAQWNQAAVTLPTPTRTGFTFKGWYDQSSGGNKIGDAGSTYTPSANTTLYAQWDVETHVVNAYAYSNSATNAAKWENNTTGGTVQVTSGSAGATSTGSFNYGAGYSVTAAVKTGYRFVGWYTAAPTNSGATWGTALSDTNTTLNLTMSTANVVYYARFDVVTYAITAKAYSNSASAQTTWANNTTGGSVQVTGGGVDGTAGATSTGTVVGGSATSLKATAATGYTFKGWFTTAPTSTSTASSSANPMSLSNVSAAATWYAKFDINTSTLTIKPNDGSWNGSTADKSYTQAYGSTLSIPVPTRTGYTFTEWTKSSTFYGSLSSTTAAATYTFPANSGVTSTITAGWAPINYSITYALDGGTHGTNHPASAAYDAPFAVSAPTKTGYTFTGWTVTSGLDANTAKWGTSNSPATAISADSTKCVNGTGDVYFKNIRSTTGAITLTATWQIDKHKVTLVPYSNSANTPGTWTANDTTGGTVSGAGTFDYNADLTISASAKAGYNFDGWYSEAPTNSGTTWDESKRVTNLATKMGTSDITYYARFSIKSFTVTAKAVADSKDDTSLKEVYASNAGCSAAPATSTVYYNKTVSLTATAGTGYEFKGWFDNEACTGNALSTSATYTTPAITAGKTYYAKFTVKSYNVTATAVADTATSTALSAANATAAGCSAAPVSSTVKHGATVTLTATAGTGYEFKGWFDNSACTGDALSTAASYTPTITAAKDYYAKFTIKSYTVAAKAYANSATDAGFTEATAADAGCTATASASTAKHGTTVTLTATAATGYDFVGWFNSSAFSGTALSAAASYTPTITANSTFYAKFEIKKITVTFNANGGSVSSGSTTATAYYGTPVATPNVAKQGFALAGWAESATETTAKYPATSTINVNDLVLAGANKTLYAVWKPYEYTIDPNSASNSSADPNKYVVGTTGGTIAVKSGETIIPGDDIESKLDITPATGYDFVEVRYAVTTAPAYNTDVTSWGTYKTSVTAEKTMPALPDGSTIVLIGYFRVRELNAKAYAYSNSASSNDYTKSAAGGTVQVKGGVIDGTVGKESESAIYSGANVTFDAKVKTGYTFDGWYTEAPSGATWDESKKVASPATTMGASDITYYAKFSINTRTAYAYAVYYDEGFDEAEGSGTKGITGGTVTVSTANASATTSGSEAVSIQAKYTQVVTYTAAAATGYEFAGWYYNDDDDFVDGEVIETDVSYDNFMPDEDIEIQGKFVPINFVVVLNPNGGSSGSTAVSGPTAAITLTYGQPYTLDGTTLPIRTSYTFIGWSESSTATTPDYTYTDDICEINAATVNSWFASWFASNPDDAESRSYCIYAVWQIAKYIVTLDNQGGTGGMTQVEVTLNEPMPTLDTLPTLNGYTLAGYYSEPGGADASGKYYNDVGTSAKDWDIAGDGILYAKWVCPVVKDATYDAATGKWTYIYEDVNGDDVSANPSDAILTEDGLSQNAPEGAKQITSVDDAKTEYVKKKVDEAQGINLNYYTSNALEELYENVIATNTDLKREDLSQVELNAYVANLARYTELEAGENKKITETYKPTINLYETKDKVKAIKDNTLTKDDSVIGNNYGKPTSNDAGTFVYTNKWSEYKQDAVDYYIYTNSRTPVIALEIDDGEVGSSVTDNKSSYPTSSVVTAEGTDVVPDKEGSYMKSAVPATDDVSSAWFSPYTKANIGTKYDYNAKEIIYLTPSFTPKNPTSTTDEIVYTIKPSDDATEKNEGLTSAQIAEIPSAHTDDFYSFRDDQQQPADTSITVCVCYHNAMNGTDDEGGTIDDPYLQMYIDQVDAELEYADTWLNQMHLYRQAGGASNWEIVLADEAVYPVDDETFKFEDTDCVLGSFAYIFDSTNESVAASYAEAGNYEAAKKEIISSIKKNPSAAQTAILGTVEDGHYYKYGLGYFSLAGWSSNYYPKKDSYVFAHLVDRWGNVFNKVWKNFKTEDYTPVITGNAMNGFTVTEDGGSNVAIIEIGCDEVDFITDLDSTFENDIFTTSGDTFTVITNKPKSNVTFAVTDNAGNIIKGKLPTDPEGNIKLTVKDLCADLSDGAYVFMVNDKEVHLNACEPAVVRDASITSTAFLGDEVVVKVKTVDTASKVQLDENGSTRTFTKTSSAATIVDNGDGTKTWTIIIKTFTKGVHELAVKAKDNNVWYDSNFVLTTTIVKKPSSYNKAIVSVENVNCFTDEKISVKVEVKPETSAIRVNYDPTGYTTTVGREDCTIETTENGTEIWTVPAMTFAKAGEYEINVLARYNSSWQTTLGETCKVTVAQKTVNGAAIYDVDVSKTDLKRGELTTLTVVTNSETTRLQLVYCGTTTTYTKSTVQVTENEDGTLTWVIDKSFNNYGDIDIVFKAKSSLGWTEEQTFGTVTVTSSRAK